MARYLISIVLALCILSIAMGLPQEDAEAAMTSAARRVTPPDVPALIEKAQAGDVFSQTVLGLIYASGQSVTKDYKEANKWFRRAAENGSGLALCWSGMLYAARGNPSRDYSVAMDLFRKAVATHQGKACGALHLGVMYLEGEGVPVNVSEGISWWQQSAAETGKSAIQSQIWLGEIYLHQENYTEAAKWLQKAAEQGDPHAQERLAMMYTNALGFIQDDAQAVKWATKAAEQGNADALHLLGFTLCCRIPSTIPEDSVTSYMWFLLAREAGDPIAPEFLAGLEANLTKEQIAEAKRRANEWSQIHAQPRRKPSPRTVPE